MEAWKLFSYNCKQLNYFREDAYFEVYFIMIYELRILMRELVQWFISEQRIEEPNDVTKSTNTEMGAGWKALDLLGKRKS